MIEKTKQRKTHELLATNPMLEMVDSCLSMIYWWRGRLFLFPNRMIFTDLDWNTPAIGGGRN